MDIVFATNNLHKLSEIREIVGKHFRLLSLHDIGFEDPIPEDHFSLNENASAKANLVFSTCKIPTFADDTGLEVDCLGGKPGVFSARYAGKEHDDQANIQKLLREMKNCKKRDARFRTAISFWWEKDREMLFEGIVNGKIAFSPVGTHGFGYDPVFIPEGFDKTFAQIPLKIKNTISHRAVAFTKLTNYLHHHFI